MAKKSRKKSKALTASKQPRIEAPETPIPSYYTNSIDLRASFWDIRLSLLEVTEASPERIVRRALANVFMSPQHAKIFAMVLNNHLKKYEEQFGVLKLPDLSE